jgi:hypothetical protein
MRGIKMECYCKIKTNILKIEADFVPDPIWCNECNCNIDMEDLPLSDQLKNDLYTWALAFGKWRDKDTEKLLKNAFQIINQYNNRGLELTEKVRKELSNKYTVLYVPSS